jgi:hypothetical protein
MRRFCTARVFDLLEFRVFDLAYRLPQLLGESGTMPLNLAEDRGATANRISDHPVARIPC